MMSVDALSYHSDRPRLTLIKVSIINSSVSVEPFKIDISYTLEVLFRLTFYIYQQHFTLFYTILLKRNE